MNTPSLSLMAAGLTLSLFLTACGDRPADTPSAPTAPTPSAPAPSAPAQGAPAQSATPAPSPAPAPSAAPDTPSTDEWLGQWDGPEGTFVRITGGQGHYDVTIQNLDGPRTFAGMAVRDTIEFQRDGQTEALRASNGEQTGMKWLSTKKDCLTVRVGEGYCRD